VDLVRALEYLYERGIRKLMVEGGGETIFSFFREGLVARYCVYVGSMVVGGRGSPTPADGEGLPQDRIVRLRLASADRMGDGILLSYEVEDAERP